MIDEQKQLIAKNQEELKKLGKIYTVDKIIQKNNSDHSNSAKAGSKFSVDALDYVNYYGLIEKKQIMFWRMDKII